jgi:hypothetical protein
MLQVISKLHDLRLDIVGERDIKSRNPDNLLQH